MSTDVASGSRVSRRSVIAVALSAIPGGGQLFNRDPARGVVLFAGATGSIGLSVLMLAWAIGTGPTVFNRYGVFFLLLAMVSIVLFLIGFIFGLYVWASAIIDAYCCSQAIERGDTAEARLWHGFKL